MMSNKEKYFKFIEKTYVPIYSQPFWLDAICLPENWNVWLYEVNDTILAAMPYYFEYRNGYKYITKAPLTQNNGIIFKVDSNAKLETRAKFEERVIDAADEFIESLDLDVYEQQYHYSFVNWLPFYWHRYTGIIRYTYVIENTKNLDLIWENFSKEYRKNIRKGYRNCVIKEGLEKNHFWECHKKIFEKQNMECPFSYELWKRLYNVTQERNCSKIIYAVDEYDNILSILFLVWDEEAVYQLLGGSMPEYQHLQSYNVLTWEGIKLAAELGKKYDFEGSVIKRISKSMREFGGEPKPYFRIRKVFNPAIIRDEAEQQIKNTIK